MHDTHFLERLPRATYAETEMALGLYRDPELVRAILAAADAPDVTRVAIALGPGDAPSWLVVARDGGFVTCLGRGMSPGACPRVSHATVTRLAARHEELRARMAYWEACADNGGDVRRLVRDVYEAGDRLSREAMVALLPLASVLWDELYRTTVRLDKVSRTLVYEESQRLLRRRDRLSSRDEELLWRIWVSEWAKAHVAVLMGACHRDILEHAASAPELDAKLPRGITSLLHFVGRFGCQAHMLRGLWCVARFGKYLVRTCKDELAEARRGLIASEALPVFALGAIGLRHDKLRAEITKFLETQDKKSISGVLRCAVVDLLSLDAAQRVETGEGFVMTLAETMSQDVIPPVDWATADATSKAEIAKLARRTILNAGCNLWTNIQTLLTMLGQLYWIVGVEPEDFYVPRDELPAPWQPEDSLTYLEDLSPATIATRAPVRAEAKPGRNEVCTCGSGKKYKRCCGA